MTFEQLEILAMLEPPVRSLRHWQIADRLGKTKQATHELLRSLLDERFIQKRELSHRRVVYWVTTSGLMELDEYRERLGCERRRAYLTAEGS